MKEPPQIDVDGVVKKFDVAVRNRHHRHNSRAVHHHIYAAKGVDGLFEEPFHIGWFSHIGLNSNGLPLGLFDCSHNFIGLGWLSRIVDNHGKAVAGQPFCYYTSNSA